LMDMYVVNVLGSGDVSLPILYRNITPATGHWLEVDLVGTLSNRDACGARVVLTSGRRTQARWLVCGSSQGSGDESILHWGGIQPGRYTLHIDWPSGLHQTLRGSAADRLVQIVEP
jgi:hypothetical protein